MSDGPLNLLSEHCAPPDPLQVFAAAGNAPRFYWEQPSTGRFRVGVGCLARITVEGPARFDAAEAGARALLDRISWQGAGPRVASLVGGFAFAPTHGAAPWQGFADGELRLPELLFTGDEEGCTRTVGFGSALSALSLRALALGRPVHGVAEFSGEKSERYVERVRAALGEIHSRRFSKVVVTRAAHATARSPIDVVAWLVALRERFPGCTLFAVGDGDTVFLGASPERLVRVHRSLVETAAIAGTAARGPTPAADRALGQALRDSRKDRDEHAIVVQHLRSILSDCCESVEVDVEPRLLKTRAVQHLCTELRARRRAVSPVTLLGLVARLHPTPAVGGSPPAPALDWIARNEAVSRGWFAGPVGFLQSDGDGEFAVALRSALVRGGHATAWAGAGIVAGSEPEAEFNETELKLRAVLGPLLWGAP